MPNVSATNLRGYTTIIDYPNGKITGLELKKLIAQHRHMPPPNEQRLRWLGRELDDDKTLDEQGFKWGGAFGVIYHPPFNGAHGGPGFRNFNFFVKNLSGVTCSVDFSNVDITVSELKKLILQKPDMPPLERLGLIWAGKLLEDERTLDDYGLAGNGETLGLFEIKANPAPKAALPESKEGGKAEALAKQGLFAKNEQSIEKQMGRAIVGLLLAIETQCKKLQGLDPNAHCSYTASVISNLSKDQNGKAFGRLLSNPEQNSIPFQLAPTIKNYVKGHEALRHLGEHAEFAGKIKKQLIQGKQEELIQEFGHPEDKPTSENQAYVLM